MTLGRTLAFLLGLVLLSGASSWLGFRTDSTVNDFGGSDCGMEDCGCPHDASPVDCCCRLSSPSSPRNAATTGTRDVSELDIDVPGAPRPTASLTSFFCNGGRRAGGSLHSSEPPALLANARLAVVPVPRAEWTTRRAALPPPELPREPATPPPRNARA